MKRLPAIVSFLALTIFLVSCSSTKQMDNQNQQTSPQSAGPGVAPGQCRIVGTVVKVEMSGSSDATDPCSKAPCLATVRVEEILGYGSGFNRTLHKDEEIKVRFSLTLSPTKEILPEVMPPLPGLSVGSRFQADLAGSPSPMMGAQKGTSQYSTDIYQVRK